jgi:spore coat protein U-like protein
MAIGLLLVSGNLLAQNCSVDASPMSFGGLEAAPGPAVDSAGSVTVNCDAPASYLIRLDAGLHSNGQFIARKMRRVQGFESMEYNLYRDASRTLIWGDGTGGSSAVQGTNPGIPQMISLYGRIYGGQNLHIGDYTDIVTVTVDW